jgi:predicted GNAT superfamily acetyltransferase
MPGTSIIVRTLRKLEEFRQCERIQQNVWGSTGVSSEALLVTQKYGGMVLGALAGRKLVGFLYAFLARRSGRLIHWSHMMAVEAGFRDRGLGFRMKLEHRRRALAQGIRSITWTFDPLQSRNAALNLTRLGAQVDEYIPDCYGRFPSAIERGLPSDRFVADWRIGSHRVERRLRRRAPLPFSTALPRVNETEPDSRGLLVNRRLHLSLNTRRLLIEVPADTDRMRALDMDLAQRWRMEARRAFQRYLNAGYRLEDFLPPGAASGGRAFYLLRRTKAVAR